MNIIITGVAGFIGYHLSKRILKENISLIGIDNMNDYYDVNLKEARLQELRKITLKNDVSFNFFKENINNKSVVEEIFRKYNPEIVINLAAQAGVRYSMENPSAYIQTNLVGFSNILESIRNYPVKHLIYASSSSVYGGNTKMPFSEKMNVDHPVSLYAATKRSNELLAHSYSHIYSIPATGLRFFTVYGPWGRPDMALFLFTKSILEGQPIKVFNHGEMTRDFTYIDDIVESIMRLLKKPPTQDKSFDTSNPNPDTSWAPHRIFNIGNSTPESLKNYIKAIEENLGIKAKKELLPMQPGDVPATSSDCTSLESYINYKPNTSIEDGIGKFISWYKKFYGK
tara:strand:- start:7094 stop:8116 length:1023 start_codon:yes stop_codon:yes gene_type:complete